MRAIQSKIVGLVGGGLLLLHAGTSLANGRFPGANSVVFQPGNPSHMMLRATYGFMQSSDGGQSWYWFCEEGFGINNSVSDWPTHIFGNGSSLLGVPFKGAWTTSNGCGWTAPAPGSTLATKIVDAGLEEGQHVIDLTELPGNPGGALVLVSYYLNGGYVNYVAETTNNGQTWQKITQPSASPPASCTPGSCTLNFLPNNVVPQTVEIAASNPQRLYVSALELDSSLVYRAGVMYRSDDHGAHWTRSFIPQVVKNAANVVTSGVYISAVHPTNPDRLYMRISDDIALDFEAGSPTSLYASSDKGQNWSLMARTSRSMLGFALSPDGSMLAYGNARGNLDEPEAGPVVHGMYLGPSNAVGSVDDGLSAAGAPKFQKVSTIQNRCLKWTSQGLYACATEFAKAESDLFSLGRYDVSAHTPGSTPAGEPFVPIYKRAATCLLACSAGTTESVCGGLWSKVQSIGASCSGGTGGTGGTGGSGGSPGCGVPAASAGAASCSIGNPIEALPFLAGFTVAIAALRRRRKRSREDEQS